MFSKILIKLIDQSITPAILLISTRIISVVLLSKSKGIPFNLDHTGFTFSSYNDYYFLNSYSTLVMLVVLTLGLSYILIKAWIFHDTHITPRVTANVFSVKLSGLIQSSFDVYTQGSIWLSYLFFLTLASAFMAYVGIIYVWVAYTSSALFLIMLIAFILDIENEVKQPKSAWNPEEAAE